MKTWISMLTKEQRKYIATVGFLIIFKASLISADEKLASGEYYAAIRADSADYFSYNELDAYGPSNWYKIAAACGKYSQSPINIERSSTIRGTAPALYMNYFSKSVASVKVTNTGESITFQLVFADKSTNRLVWNKKSVYVFDSLHFHWGNYCTGGSEHTVDGHRYVAEVHLVHYNEKYRHIAAAVSQPDGLAVIGVFFETSEEANNDGSNNNRFIKFLDKVRTKGSSYVINDLNGVFTIKQLIKNEVKEYYSYKGSLTTPPCAESVRWIVSKKTVKLYPSELAEMQKLQKADGLPLLHNYRPLQALNGRTVYEYNYQGDETAGFLHKKTAFDSF